MYVSSVSLPSSSRSHHHRHVALTIIVISLSPSSSYRSHHHHRHIALTIIVMSLSPSSSCRSHRHHRHIALTIIIVISLSPSSSCRSHHHRHLSPSSSSYRSHRHHYCYPHHHHIRSAKLGGIAPSSVAWKRLSADRLASRSVSRSLCVNHIIVHARPVARIVATRTEGSGNTQLEPTSMCKPDPEDRTDGRDRRLIRNMQGKRG